MTFSGKEPFRKIDSLIFLLYVYFYTRNSFFVCVKVIKVKLKRYKILKPFLYVIEFIEPEFYKIN